MSMATQRPQNLPPIWERSTKKTTKVHVYVNGDRHFPGREVNIFKRSNFDTWLDDLTWTFKPRKGRFSQVYTPTAGHRVNNLESLKDGDKVVAACRWEKFQPVGYGDISNRPKKGPRFSYDVEPGHSRRYQVSSRYRKVDTSGVLIHIWLNGQTVEGAKHLLLPPSRPSTLSYVLQTVSDAYSMPSHYAVEKLFALPGGEEVSGVEQIRANGCYVAARRSEKFILLDYRESARPNLSTSPRVDLKRLPPISRSTKASSQSSPEHSITSHNGYRRERAKREEDGVFHNRPVKHKRSSEKVRQADYDQDTKGVFKAKSQNQHTRGAKQIEDTRQTKTDLPIDLQPAEEVKEDLKGKDKKDKKGKKDTSSPPRAADQQSTHRANSKRSGDSSAGEPARHHQAKGRRELEDRQRADKAREQQDALRQSRAQREEEEEEERRRQEEEEEERRRRRREEVEEERRREEEEERMWREEEEEMADTKQRQQRQQEGQEGQEGQEEDSPYRSGTELLLQHPPLPAQDSALRDKTPLPETETGRGRHSRHSEKGGGADEGEVVDWGLGPDEGRQGWEEEERERERAALTIQAHYRGMKARQQTAAIRAGGSREVM